MNPAPWLLALLLLSASLSSVRADEVEDKKFAAALTGKWIRERTAEDGTPMNAKTEYSADGIVSAMATVVIEGKTNHVYANGTWKVAGGKLTTGINQSSHANAWPGGPLYTERIKEVTGEKYVVTNAAGEELTYHRPTGKEVFVLSEQVWDNMFEGHQHILLVCEFKGEMRKPEGGGIELNFESTIIKAFKGPGTMGQRIRHSLYSGEGLDDYKFVPGTLHFVFVDGDLTQLLTVETGGGHPFTKEAFESVERYVRKFVTPAKAGGSSPEKK